MGTIKQGILGGFSGKVGSVVGGSWKGIAYMRSQAQSVHNPRTEGQLDQRSKFALTINFLKPITDYVRTGYKHYAHKQTAFNAAMSYNIKNAISGDYPNYSVDFTKTLVARGSLVPAHDAAAVSESSAVTFTWTDNSGEGNAQMTDIAMPLVYNISKGYAIFSDYVVRAESSVTVAVPTSWSGDSCAIYLAFVSEDGTLVSDSLFLGEEIIV